MKSVLIATDFVRKADGTLTPLEINTNSSHEITFNHTPLSGSTTIDFLSNFSEVFNHVEFNTFLQTNGINKLKVIDKPGSMGIIFESFANHYGIEYDFISVNEGSLSIPAIDDAEDTLIIRVSYDAYALIDDLYARDMSEFHNLIKNESFASPVAFNTDDESNLDTITVFEPSIDGVVPNYLVKPRIPGYPQGVYPKLYRLDTIEELNALKASISENEFIQKYEYNAALGRVNNRVSFIRSMDLVYGSNLDVINIMTYKSISAVSTENSLIRYTSEVLTDKRLDPAFGLKWYPKIYSLNVGMYHFDANDEALLPDYNTIPFGDIEVGTTLFGINFDNNLKDLTGPVPLETLYTFETGSTNVTKIIENTLNCIMINIKAVDESDIEHIWYDGLENKYLIQKSGSSEVEYLSQQSSFMEIGDKIFTFDIESNQVKPLTVTDIYFDIKDIDTYRITLENQFREFLTPLSGSTYLIQHNASFCSQFCGQFIMCGTTYWGQQPCGECGKGDFNCPNCRGGYGIGYVCNSDRRLKKNIKLVGLSTNGINIYEFSYLNEDNSVYRGVIAQELLESDYSDAVLIGEDGFYKVDYSKIDVKFEKIN